MMIPSPAIADHSSHARVWHTASYTNDRGACVEVSEGPLTGVRDTKNRHLDALFFSAADWGSFLGAVKGDQV